jgi:Carboxypeptidase regulatory-like domain/TonB-dependent Receptor Plug Domain
MRSIRRPIAAISFFLCVPAAEAQMRLDGRVIDNESEQPIPSVSVLLQDARGRRLGEQLADELGQFSFLVKHAGPVRLRADRIGYRTTTTPLFDVAGYTTYRVEVRLDVTAVPAAPLEVLARSRGSPTLAGFEDRRLAGFGWFITREEIEQRNPPMVTDILAAVPGVWLQPVAGGGNRRIVYMARATNCPAQIFIDGFHINRSLRPAPGRRVSTTETFPIDDMVRPGSVEGIEVYQGLARIPAEFRTQDVACGVVAIWTRRR